MKRVPTQGRGVGGGGPGPCLASCCPTQQRDTVLGTSSHGTAAHSAPGLSHLLWDSVSSLQPCSRRLIPSYRQETEACRSCPLARSLSQKDAASGLLTSPF